MKKTLTILTLSLIFFSCNKLEGEGGTSSIIGKITTNDVNGAGEIQATFPGADEDIYIIYGKDNTAISDKVTASYDGSYRFDNLTAGTYKVFAYSKCNTCPSGSQEVVVTTTINTKKELVTAPELIIEE
jgi:hypothetical protein